MQNNTPTEGESLALEHDDENRERTALSPLSPGQQDIIGEFE